MPPAQAQEYFHYDCSAEVIRIRCPLWELTRKPLYQELLGKHPAVKAAWGSLYHVPGSLVFGSAGKVLWPVYSPSGSVYQRVCDRKCQRMPRPANDYHTTTFRITLRDCEQRKVRADSYLF